MSAGSLRAVRLLGYAGCLLVAALVEDGRTCHLAAALVTAYALGSYWYEAGRSPRLAMFWCAGFLLIISTEGLTAHSLAYRYLGTDVFDEASRYLVATHVVTLLVHDLVHSEGRVPTQTVRWTIDVRRIVVLLVFSTSLALLYFAPLVIESYSVGRVGLRASSPTTGRALLQGFATSVSIVVPVISAYLAKSARGRARVLLLALVAGFVAVQFVIGVRFLLLMTIVGTAIAWIVPGAPRKRVVAVLVASALVLAAASAIVQKTRTFGIAATGVGEAVSTIGLEDIALDERVVYTMGLAVKYTRKYGYTGGRSSSAVLVFWVPRAIWPDKPALVGYWLPRVFFTIGVSDGYSAAQGFSGDAYLDFGFFGGITMWILLGALFGLLERRVAAICASGDIRVVLVAPLFGGAFFAVRSLDTAFLVLSGVLLLTIVLLVGAGARMTRITGDA